MALLGKKTATTEASGKRPAKAKRKLRENERLRSVIKESTHGAAIETLDRNVRFRLSPDPHHNPRHLALLMHSDAIGGLSEKTKRDEAKGALVQQIISDQIEAIALGDMLDREFVSFVPSQGTLELLGEYEMMVKAEYFWVVFTTVDGELTIDQNIGPATYAQARAIQAGASIQDVLSEGGEEGQAIWSRIAAGGQLTTSHDDDEVFGQDAIAEAESVVAEQAPQYVDTDELTQQVAPQPEMAAVGSAVAVEAPVTAPVVVPAGGGGFIDDGDVGNEGDDFEYSDIGFVEHDIDEHDNLIDEDGFVPDVIEDDSTPFDSGEDDETDAGSGEISYQQYMKHNEGREFTEQEVRDTIARRFLSDDLDLTIDMVEFELAFQLPEVPQINLSEALPADGSDWLGSLVAQSAEMANTELMTLRQRHESELSQQYIEYTSHHIQSVIREVSIADPTSKFGRMMVLCEEDRDESNSARYQAAGVRRKAIEDRFKEEADAAAEAAAQQARVTFMNMNRGRREAALGQIDSEVAQEIDGRYESQRQHVLNLRRLDADMGMQQGKTLIFEELSRVRQDQADAEQALLQKWTHELGRIIEANRKADVVRAEVLSEELRRENIVDETRREHADRVAQIRADHDARVAELESRIAQVQQDAVVQLTQAEEHWSRQLSQTTEDRDRVSRLVTELNTQMEGMSTAIRQQYAEQIETLTLSRDQAAQDVVRTAEAAKRTQRAAIGLMALLSASALAIGLVAGWVVWKDSDSIAVAPAPIEVSAEAVT